ncbi:MAG: ABC transporter ATP-binding protein [Nitrospinae bacterium]|nr:ABC transporter ATP-binding protein [Nitrospinota bacterium]
MRLEAENIIVELGEREALKGVSASFQPGAFTGVIGANGAGKTTLLRALAGLAPLQSGRISLEGEPVDSFDRKETARRVGYLAQKQEPAFPFRVDETVMMGRYPHQGRLSPETEADRAAVDAALRGVDAAGLAARAINELSGGELQRVLIARTLAAQTPVLLLDEPFANLDVRHCLDILEILRAQAREGRTVVVSVHDLNLAHRFCDHLLLLYEGEILAQGDASDVLTRRLIEKAFQVHAEILTVNGKDERYFILRALEERE